MAEHEEQFVTDKNGKRVSVVLDIADYQQLLEDQEELETIRAFDRAKSSGEAPVPFEKGVADFEPAKNR